MAGPRRRHDARCRRLACREPGRDLARRDGSPSAAASRSPTSTTACRRATRPMWLCYRFGIRRSVRRSPRGLAPGGLLAICALSEGGRRSGRYRVPAGQLPPRSRACGSRRSAGRRCRLDVGHEIAIARNLFSGPCEVHSHDVAAWAEQIVRVGPPPARTPNGPRRATQMQIVMPADRRTVRDADEYGSPATLFAPCCKSRTPAVRPAPRSPSSRNTAPGLGQQHPGERDALLLAGESTQPSRPPRRDGRHSAAAPPPTGPLAQRVVGKLARLMGIRHHGPQIAERDIGQLRQEQCLIVRIAAPPARPSSRMHTATAAPDSSAAWTSRCPTCR